MGFIYCIENKINHKKYIGKTTKTIKDRIKEHIRDSRKETEENRPLYRAFNKYGVQNFHVFKVLECKESQLDFYEIYYIKNFNTYGHNGYNATKGGDGSTLYDYDDIIYLYQEGLCMSEVSKVIGCCTDTVKIVLTLHNIKIRDIAKSSEKEILQFDKNNNYIQSFNSIKNAGRWIIAQGITKTDYKNAAKFISQCAQGKKKSAYKYIWKFKL